MRNIKELRTYYRLTQDELADKLNISIRTIQNWEYNHRKAPDYVIGLINYKLQTESLMQNIIPVQVRKKAKTIQKELCKNTPGECNASSLNLCLESIFKDETCYKEEMKVNDCLSCTEIIKKHGQTWQKWNIKNCPWLYEKEAALDFNIYEIDLIAFERIIKDLFLEDDSANKVSVCYATPNEWLEQEMNEFVIAKRMNEIWPEIAKRIMQSK